MSRAPSLESPLQHTEVSGLPSFLEMEPEPATEPYGLVQGRYELGTVIARGGMGTVYRARDRMLNRTVAVKVLRSRFANRADLLRRFLDEAQIASKLQHPGVVPVYELGAFPDGRPFIAMKLVEGMTLSQLLKERKGTSEDLPNFLKVFDSLVQTVSYAHSRGIIHRDLKPENVMVGAFGEVQVMDWGLAKFLENESTAQTGWSPESIHELQMLAPSADSRLAGSQLTDQNPLAEGFQLDQPLDPNTDDPNLTRHGEIFGTAPYMPPEQARGQTARINRRSDVFSLGAILCEIITGQPPYVGEPLEVRSKAQAGALAEAYARLDRSATDPSLVLLAKYCLAVNPKDRPESAGELNELLQDYFAKSQARARAAELHQLAMENEAAEACAREKLAKRSREFSLLIAALSVIFASILVSGFVWSIRDRNTLVLQANLVQEELNRQIEERDQLILSLIGSNTQSPTPEFTSIDSKIQKALDERNYPLVISLLRQEITEQPNNPKQQKQLAELLEATEDYSEAEKILQKGIELLGGAWSQYLVNFQKSYRATPQALQNRLQLLKADPENLTLRWEVARLLVEQGRYREAVSQYRTLSSQIDPMSTEQVTLVQKEMREASNLMATQLKLPSLLQSDLLLNWETKAEIARVGVLSGKAKEVLPLCEKLQEYDTAYAPLAVRCALLAGGDENQQKALRWLKEALQIRENHQKDSHDLRQIPEARRLGFAPPKEMAPSLAEEWQRLMQGH
jgi:serine/threonine protein kinase